MIPYWLSQTWDFGRQGKLQLSEEKSKSTLHHQEENAASNCYINGKPFLSLRIDIDDKLIWGKHADIVYQKAACINKKLTKAKKDHKHRRSWTYNYIYRYCVGYSCQMKSYSEKTRISVTNHRNQNMQSVSHNFTYFHAIKSKLYSYEPETKKYSADWCNLTNLHFAPLLNHNRKYQRSVKVSLPHLSKQIRRTRQLPGNIIKETTLKRKN